MFYMSIIHNLEYFHSAHFIEDLPDDVGYEIAFAGRSNAGKSSAINTLANHNRLAYVSKQPGRTQLINFFQMRYGINNKIVDLPGYGYAKVNVNTKKHWDVVLPYYLQKRKSLIGLIIVMDIRHALTKLDEQMIEWFLPTKKSIHILLTKSDKLSRNQAQKEVNKFTKKIEACNFNGNISYQTFSSLKKIGLDDVEEIFLKWLPSHS
jgi:GTP-binding protein